MSTRLQESIPSPRLGPPSVEALQGPAAPPARFGPPPRSLRVRANGNTFHLLEWGGPSRPAVLMVHGMRAHARWFTPVGPAVGAEGRALALDLRGHGESDHAREYGHATFADDVVGLIDALGLDRPILLGHSMGGAVATRAAAELGDRLAGLVLVDAGMGPPPPSGPLGWRRRLAQRLRRAVRHTAPDPPERREFPSFEAARERFVLRPGATCVAPDLMEHIAHHAIEARPDGTFGWRFDPGMRGFQGRRRRAPRYRAVTCPVLLVYGAASPILARVEPEKLARRFRSAPWTAIERIKGAYHHVFLDQPAAFNDVLLSYVPRFER